MLGLGGFFGLLKFIKTISRHLDRRLSLRQRLSEFLDFQGLLFGLAFQLLHTRSQSLIQALQLFILLRYRFQLSSQIIRGPRVLRYLFAGLLVLAFGQRAEVF